jgi:predicted DNA-binding protein (MmcQ/YjbR family)
MAGYEATAFELIEDMRRKHDKEQQEMIERVRGQVKYRPGRDLMTLRNQEKIFFSVKEYENAQFMRLKSNEQEVYEIAEYEQKVYEAMERESLILRQKQDL